MRTLKTKKKLERKSEQKSKKNKLFALIAPALLAGTFLCAGAFTAYAAENPGTDSEPTETLSESDIAMLEDLFSMGFGNLFTPDSTGATDSNTNTPPIGYGNYFTPDGTGTVIDNAVDGDGKEFFTVETPDGNVFYIIVDRQRTSDNVYLLNAVTENDLASLAKKGDGKSVSAIPEKEQEKPQEKTEQQSDEKTETEKSTDNESADEDTAETEKNDGDKGTIIFAVIAFIAFGAAGYYVKIIRPKQLGITPNGSNNDETDGDDFYDEEMNLDNDDDDYEGEDY